MCLILLSLSVHPEYPLLLAANRDEFYQRPTAPAQFWQDSPGLLAGRDLRSGGTWMGLGPQGRWAGLTNFREPESCPFVGPSRGQLVLQFLSGNSSPPEFLAYLQQAAPKYAGYSLLFGVGTQAYYHSNRGDSRGVEAGLHGLSNHLLDTPWPKVRHGLARMRDLNEPDALIRLLRDDRSFPDDELPDTGVGQSLERGLAPLFIRMPDYGTRCSTVIRLSSHGLWSFVERRYDPAGNWEDSEFQLLQGPCHQGFLP